MIRENPTLDRLENQIEWYDNKSKQSQFWFKSLKLVEIIAAALIPFLSLMEIRSIFMGLLGILIVIIENVLNLYQFQNNWITYRSTCEELKHEKYIWLAKAGPYSDSKNPNTLLAERIESLISREHSKWICAQKDIEKHKDAFH